MKTAVTLLTLTAALALHTMSAFAQSGAVDLTFMHRTGPNSNVNAVVVQPDGKVVFGGAFTEVNFTLCNHLARADADGEVDASFDPGGGPDGVVHALALQSDGKMLIGGAFANYNGTSRTRVARLNADGSLDATFDPGTGADGLVKFVAVQTNGQVLIQGNFTNYNGTPRLGLARLNANGSLDPSFDPGSRALNLSALAWQPNGKVVFSGAFTNLDGFTSTNLARLNADGSLDTNFTALARLSNLANSVVVQRDGNILLTGLFTNVNGAPFNRIARLSSDGSLDPGFNPGTGLYIPFTFPWWFTGYPIRSVEQPDGQLLVWGAFTNYNGTPCNGAVRLNPNGSLDPSFSPLTGIFDRSAMTYSPVTSVCVLGDGQVLVPNRAMPYLRRLLANGSVDATWMSETGASGTVSAIVLQSDGMSLLVGTFAQINGVPRTGLARLHADGRLDASFNPNLGPSAGVYSIALQPDGELVVGGSFTSVNGVAQTNLARLHADGTLDATFNPTLGPNVVQTVLLQPDGRVLVTGQFATGPGTEDWTSLIRLHADGTKDAAYDVRWQDGWYDTLRQRLALQSDGKLVISGEFTSVNGVARTSLARLNSDGSLDLTFNPSLSAVPREEQYAEVHALALQPDGKLLVAGSLQFLDQGVFEKQPLFVRLHPDGRLDETFAPVLGGDSLTAYALLVQPDGRILLSGYFNGPNGATLRLARFNPDGQWDSTFNPGSGPDNYVVCLALQTDGHLLIGGGFTSVNGVPRSHMARLINELTAPPVPTLTSAYVTSWAGSNATFEVSMVGLPPFSFQWQFTGTNLPGRTALPLQLTNLLAADAGLYTLVVSNASGTVTSAPVRLTVLTATARPGTLDSTFHPGGGGSEGIVFSLAEQPDGKVFVGGYFSTFDGEPHGGLVRLYPDGSVDTNFTASGYVGQGAVTWVLLQPDGKLVVRGWFTNFNGVSVTNLVRLDPNGSLDPSFTASINMTDACGGLGTAVPMPMALQPDGKIVIGGPFGEVNGVAVTNLVRLDPDGSIDPGFTTSFSAAYCTAAIALQPDGRMLTGGAGGVTRLETNGVSDASFNAGPIGWVVAIVLQPDGKIVIGGGFQMVHGVPRVNLARLNPDGTLDETFVPPVSDWLANSQVNTLVLQPDGKLVAGLWTTEAPGVARFNPDGSLDSSFHRGYCTSFAFLGGILSMIRLANGQILVGGDLSYYDSIPVAQIARLHGDEAISGLLPFSIGTRWNAGVFELGLFGEAGRTYTIEASTGLPAFSVWTNLISSGTNWLADPESPASPQRFYRARTTN